MTEDKSNARKYALTVVLMIIAISLVFTGAEASSGSGETTQWNAGTSSCTITAGNTQCSNLFTWTPTPLSAAPCSGCAEATPTSATGSINDQTIIGASVDSVFFSIGNDFGTAGKWL